MKKLKADEEKADNDFTERMEAYEKSRGYVSISQEELKKLRRARTDTGTENDGIDDRSQWKFHTVTGEHM